MDWDAANDLLYVGGQFTTYQGVTRNRIVRLTASAAVDTTFAIGTAANNIVYTIVRDTQSGKIYVGGNFTSFAGTALNRFLRLNSDGTRDTGFAVSSGFGAAVRTLAVTADGSALYAGGDFTTYAGSTVNRIARLLASGARDTAFVHGTGVEASVFAISPASESEILWGGQFTLFNGTARNRVMLTDSLGTPNDELVPFGAGLNSSSYDAVSVADGMKTIVGAFTSYNARTYNRIIRLGSDNQIDTSFAIGAGLNNTAYTITTNPANGKVYVGGIFTSFAGTALNRIVAINQNGSRDTGFVIGTGFNSDVLVVRYDTSIDKLYVGGKFTTYKGTSINRIVRLNTDGTIDTSFAVGTGFNLDVNSMLLNSDGSLYVGGGFTSYNGTAVNRIIKLLPDGSVDGSFNPGNGFNSGNVSTIAQGDGVIYAGGSFTSYQGVSSNRIASITGTGARNTGFAPGSGFNNTVYSIDLDAFTSDLLVGGNFTQYGGVANVTRITRLRANGVRETSFATGLGANAEVRKVIVEPYSVYAAGLFSTYDGVIAGSFMRLQHYGTMD